MIWCAHAVQTLHVMLQDCIECMGVGANMGRSDNIAEEGARAVAATAQGASVAKEMGDVRYSLCQHVLPGDRNQDGCEHLAIQPQARGICTVCSYAIPHPSSSLAVELESLPSDSP